MSFDSLKRLKSLEKITLEQIESRSDLQQMVFAALMMAAIDEYIDDDEIELIHGYAKQHWRDDFGDLSEFLTETDQQLSEFLFPPAGAPSIEEQRQRFMQEVIPKLDANKQRALLTLMREVLEADEIQDPHEIGLLLELADHLADFDR